MKKAIIILTILSIITIGFGAYEGYLYVNSLDELKAVETTKQELIDSNINLEQENINLKEEYEQKTQDLLKDNKGCELWEKQEEVVKKIKE